MLLEESKQAEVGNVVAVGRAVLGRHMGLVCTPEQVHRQAAGFSIPAGGLDERVEGRRVIGAGLPRVQTERQALTPRVTLGKEPAVEAPQGMAKGEEVLDVRASLSFGELE